MMAKTFDERELMKEIIVTVQIIETTKHKVLKKIGFWLVKTGFKIAGIGEVRVLESEE